MQKVTWDHHLQEEKNIWLLVMEVNPFISLYIFLPEAQDRDVGAVKFILGASQLWFVRPLPKVLTSRMPFLQAYVKLWKARGMKIKWWAGLIDIKR